MSFYQEWQQLDWDQLQAQVVNATAEQVAAALAQPRKSLADFAALISAAAEPYLPQMMQEAQRLTRQRFGQGVSMYLPLYLTNLCANDCSYCGFSMSNAIKRKILNEEEVLAECEAIAKLGYQNLLLVTGEHERKGGIDYFRRMLPLIKPYAPYLSMEVQPLATDEYAELVSLGLDGVMVYQETYHAPSYAAHHLRGKKQDMAWRMDTPDRLGQAGVDKIGLGVLLGLADWRTDSLMLAHHLQYLRKHHWRSRYSMSFPRLRPCTGGISPVSAVSERQLVQLVCAWRLLDPELELSLSTRERPALRDALIPLAITSVSAGSSTQPGGYAQPAKELEQFHISDERPTTAVAQALQQRGLELIWLERGPGAG
ncbi:2-iminoacetate synthase ThiH [Pseudaeromonas sp. ZJS20]|uniref:2-iminoacetate synthase ThiH n=1 Tax=Pseudaeromonas aegiceratis TaxID=3153928 RepID=UPI00390CAF10